MQTLQWGKQELIWLITAHQLSTTVSCSAAWQTFAFKLWFFPCHDFENCNCSTICHSLTMLATRIKNNPGKRVGVFSCTILRLFRVDMLLSTSIAKLLCSPLKYHASPMIPDNHINSFKQYVMTSFKYIAPKGLILDQGITIHHTFMTNLILWNYLLHNAAYVSFSPNSKCLLLAQTSNLAWS